MNERVLIIEDERTLVETLKYNLEKEGYQVHAATDGEAGLALARSTEPEIIILDLMLPRMDGMSVCRTLRQEGMEVPILMLTAKADEIDKVLGLEMGADDYVTKPFSLRELLARINALLRRSRKPPAQASLSTPEPLVSGDLVLDLARREVRKKGSLLKLSPREFDLLVFLVRNRSLALSRNQILINVWDQGAYIDQRTVDVHVRWLREKIEEDPRHPQRLLTVRGVGYLFEG